MSTPKSTKKKSIYAKCEKCGTIFSSGDKLKHLDDCPPTSNNNSYYFIKNQTLFGKLQLRASTIENSVGLHELNWVFLSSSCMDICGMAKSNWVVLKFDNLAPIAKRARAVENGLSSVYLEKPVLELYFGNVKNYPNVSVSKLGTERNLLNAREIILESGTTEINQDLHRILTQLHKDTFLTSGNKVVIKYYGRYLKFAVKNVIPEYRDFDTAFEGSSISDNFFKVTEETKWLLFKENVKDKNLLSQIGGLDKEIKKIQWYMDLSLDNKQRKPIIYKSVLLYGYPGTGKTMLANALAKASGTFFVSINNVSDKNKEIFDRALHTTETIIVLDNVDTMCPKSSKSLGIGEFSREIVSFFEKVKSNEHAKVFIIGTTNDIDNIDPWVKKEIFDTKIEITIPKPESRKDILKKMIKDMDHNLSDEEFSEISLGAHGYVGRDLLDLCNKAKEHMLSDSRESLDIEDMKFALKNTAASAMKGALVEVSDVKWSDIAGQKELKLILKCAVDSLLKNSQKSKRIGLSNSVLMYGPPGCSKTMVARALATESGLNFLSVKGPEVFNKYVGESERAIRDLFKKARQVAPSIIFFDEIDALGGARSLGDSSACSVQERVMIALITEMDGIGPLENVIVLGATNRPDRLDPSLLRAGRFSHKVYVSLPDDETREEIFKLHLSKMKVDSSIDIKFFVDSTRGYSGSEIAEVCYEAGRKVMYDKDDEMVRLKHFEYGLKKVLPVTTEDSLRLYEEFSRPRGASRVRRL